MSLKQNENDLDTEKTHTIENDTYEMNTHEKFRDTDEEKKTKKQNANNDFLKIRRLRNRKKEASLIRMAK
jgi:hypothetical protein